MAQSTKQIMIETFLELLEELPFDKITVTDIVQKCNVNRNTFYYHFLDIYDLLDEVLENDAEKLLSANSLTESKVSFGTWVEGCRNAIQFIKLKKKTAYHLYNSEGKTRMEDFLYKVINNDVLFYLKELSAEKNIQEEVLIMLAQFYAHALAGTFYDWLKSGMNYDLIEYLIKIDKILEGNFKEHLASLEGIRLP